MKRLPLWRIREIADAEAKDVADYNDTLGRVLGIEDDVLENDGEVARTLKANFEREAAKKGRKGKEAA